MKRLSYPQLWQRRRHDLSLRMLDHNAVRLLRSMSDRISDDLAWAVMVNEVARDQRHSGATKRSGDTGTDGRETGLD